MAIFYTDSASLNNLEVTGSTILSGSLNVSGATVFGSAGLTGSLFGTASLATSASYISPANLPSIISASSVTASAGVVSYGPIQIFSSSGVTNYNPNSAYWYTSGSGIDLWYKHKSTSQVKMDWFEGVLETGLIYGGIAGFSGSQVYINQGEGIIVNHSATTSSVTSPTVTYVQWPAQTASINVTNGYVTYLAINSAGLVTSQSTKFASVQYHDAIPLGAVGHFNQQAIAAKGDQVNTQHSPLAQLADFSRNFGPIKVGGYGITPQSGSLRFSRASGDAFIYGGFYTVNPETPSNYSSPDVATGSIAYVFRTGSTQGYAIDANNNSFYTAIRPGFWDTGVTTGISTASVASNEWTIQRVFIEPVTGAHYIYYGQSKYSSLANAVAALTTDQFAEGPATSLFTVFIGYLIVNGTTTNLADTGSNSIVTAGLFRNTSAGSVGGGAAAQKLTDLSNVTITSPSNGQALVYSSGIWINGNPTSASVATTASAATSITFTPSTASFSNTASFSTTASFTQIAATASYFSGYLTFPSGLDISGSLFITGSEIITGSLNVTQGITGSLFGTSSWATSASWAPGATGTGAGFPFSGSALITGSVTVSSSNAYINITGSQNTIALSDGTNNVSLGTGGGVSALNSNGAGLFLKVNGNGVFYNTLALSPETNNAKDLGGVSNRWNTLYINNILTSGSVTVSGSLLISQSGRIGATITGSSATYDEVNTSVYQLIKNNNSGNSASAELWIVNDLGGIATNTYYLNAGINSSNYNVPNQVGGANEAFLTSTGSNLLIGNQTTGNNSTIKFFSGNPATSYAMTITGSTTVTSGSLIPLAGVTGSIFSGSLFNVIEMSMAVSGTITASGTTTINLNLNQANFFTVSASAAGTVTWQITNPPPAGRAQTFVIEYTNGGIKTNNWFTNTRWPAGIAPTLTSASVNPDLLSFTTDDAGTNWRGVLLQRGSA